MKKDSCSLLINGLKEMGMLINNEQVLSISEHVDLLMEWNNRFNLTAIKNEKDIITKHILDSLALLTKINIYNNDSVADIGTGAGFPGIPLKVLRPSSNFLLIESSTKKAEFIEKVINKIGLEKIKTIRNRAERVAKDQNEREKHSLVVAKAVASINILAEYALPLVKIGGHGVFYKSINAFKEVNEAEYAIKLLGGCVEDIANVVVPFLDAERYLVIIKKVAKSPQEYPRKPGTPVKRPLREQQ